MDKWEVGRPLGVCATTGRALAEGEEFYAVLYEEDDTFRRRDYCLEAWKGEPENAFCSFKTRLPVKGKKKKLLVDDEMLISFFERLENETELSRLHFRFVLALILMRKRILKYEESRRVEDGREFWQMRLVKRNRVHQVLNPRLDDQQISDVTGQLGSILNQPGAALDTVLEETSARE